MQLSDLFRRSRRVEIGPDSVKIGDSQDRLAALLGSNELEFTRDRPIDPSDDVLTLTAPVQLTRVGREMKLLVDDSNDNRSPDTGLLRVVTRAYDVQRRLAEDTTLTVHDIAHQERVTSATFMSYCACAGSPPGYHHGDRQRPAADNRKSRTR